MFNKFLPLIVFLIVLPVMLIKISSLNIWEYDDGISLLAATGHQSEYHENPPTNKLTKAEEWKKLWHIEDKFCFNEIKQGLISHDIHPPLYFWLLHLWILIWGQPDLIMGPVLNIILFLFALFALNSLCRKFKLKTSTRLFTHLFWISSSAVLVPLHQIRQYVLLTLITILFHNAVIAFLNNKNLKNQAFVISITALGLLTHYHFFLIAFSAILFVLASQRYDHSTKLIFFKDLALTGLFFILVNPFFYQSFLNQQGQWEVITIVSLKTRTFITVKSFLNFFFPSSVAKSIGLFVSFHYKFFFFLVLLIIAAILFLLYLRLKADKKISFKVSYLLFNIIFISSVVIILYLSNKTPYHAIRSKYLCHLYPLFSLFLGVLLQKYLSKKILVVTVSILVVYQLVSSSFEVKLFIDRKQVERKYNYKVDESALFLIDDYNRGILPRAFYHFSPEQKVFVSDQNTIISRFDSIIDDFGDNFVYMSECTWKTNSVEKRQAILTKFEKRDYYVTDTKKSIYGLYRIYSVSKKNE